MRDKRIKKFLNYFSDIIPLKAYIKFSSQKLLLPFYHNISNDVQVHTKHIFKIKNEKQFISDVEYLLKHFKPVDLNQLIEINNGNLKPGGNCFWLSFDDGLSEVFNIAEPILREKGVPFGVFINTNFIDNKDLFYRYKASILIDKIQNSDISGVTMREIEKELIYEKLYKKSIIKSIYSISYFNKHVLDSIAEIIEFDFHEYLLSNKPYLTTFQINELIKHGVSIGSHSLDHPKFRDISLKEQLRQTKESIDFLDLNFRPSYKIFSFPFNDIKVRKEYFETVYKNKIIDASFGSSGLKHDEYPNHFHRLSMENPEISVSKLISTEYLYYLLKIPFYKNDIKRN